MALKETAGLYETLKTEWNKKNPNLSKCGEILSKLKVAADVYLSVCWFYESNQEHCLFRGDSAVSKCS